MDDTKTLEYNRLYFSTHTQYNKLIQIIKKQRQENFTFPYGVKVVEFHDFSFSDIVLSNFIYLLHKQLKVISLLKNHCTLESCPEMCAGNKYKFFWGEGCFSNNPKILPVLEYLKNLIEWFDSIVDDSLDENFINSIGEKKLNRKSCKNE